MPDCKQAYRPNPKLLQKVGLPPETKVLYRAPKPEEEEEEDEDYEPCEKCGGVVVLWPNRIGRDHRDHACDERDHRGRADAAKIREQPRKRRCSRGKATVCVSLPPGRPRWKNSSVYSSPRNLAQLRQIGNHWRPAQGRQCRLGLVVSRLHGGQHTCVTVLSVLVFQSRTREDFPCRRTMTN